MSYGTYAQGLTRGNTPGNRFRSISSIQGARDVKDLACRVQTALDNLNSQLNSAAQGWDFCCAEDAVLYDYKDQKMTGGTSAWYVSSHVGSTQKLADCNWFAFTSDGRQMMVGYDQSTNYYIAWYSLSGPTNRAFTSSTPDGNTSFLVGVYDNLGSTPSAGNFGWVAPNDKFCLDFSTTAVRVRTMDRAMDLVSSASNVTGTDFSPKNGLVYDRETGTMWVASGTNKYAYILSFDEDTGVISSNGLWEWTNNDKVMSFGWNPFDRILVASSDGGRIRSYDVSDPLTPVELDNHSLSADSASLATSTVRCSVDCEDGSAVYFLVLNAASTARLAGSYSMSSVGIMTINETVTVQNDSITTYTGEGFWSSEGIFRFLAGHTGGGTRCISVDFSDLTTPVVSQTFTLPVSGAASAYYQFPRFDVLVQYDGNADGFRTHVGLKDTSDDTKLKTITIDQLTFNDHGCLVPLVVANNRMIPGLNAQLLQGYGVGEIQLRQDNATTTWLYQD